MINISNIIIIPNITEVKTIKTMLLIIIILSCNYSQILNTFLSVCIHLDVRWLTVSYIYIHI